MTHWLAVVPAPALVVLLTGPSGCGKSSLAHRSGLPVLGLDSFYKDGDDPTLPRPDGAVDWDSPEAWDAERALRVVHRLAHERQVDVPRYDIAQDRTVGAYPFDLGRAPAFVAEGIFAGELVAGCRDLGILGDALCLRQHAAVTFYRRLTRDLRERRKSPPVLVRRGVALYRAEAETVTRQILAGTYPCGAEEALYRIRLAAHARALPAWLPGSVPAGDARDDTDATPEPAPSPPEEPDEDARAGDTDAVPRTRDSTDTTRDHGTSPDHEASADGDAARDRARGCADEEPTRVLTAVDASAGHGGDPEGDDAPA